MDRALRASRWQISATMRSLSSSIWICWSPKPGNRSRPVFKRAMMSSVVSSLRTKTLQRDKRASIYFKGRVFRRPPDRMMLPFLQRVGRRPAGPVEAVNFVDKDDGPLAKPRLFIRPLHDRADFLDAAGHSRKSDETGFCRMGDDLCKGCLSHAGRAQKSWKKSGPFQSSCAGLCLYPVGAAAPGTHPASWVGAVPPTVHGEGS